MRRSEGSRLGRRLSSWPFLFFFPRAKGVDDEILNADNAGMLSILLFSLVRSAVELATSRQHHPLGATDAFNFVIPSSLAFSPMPPSSSFPPASRSQPRISLIDSTMSMVEKVG